jgi:hypothetical protein
MNYRLIGGWGSRPKPRGFTALGLPMKKARACAPASKSCSIQAALGSLPSVALSSVWTCEA